MELRKFFWYNQSPTKTKKNELKKYAFMTDKSQSNINQIGKSLSDIMNSQKISNGPLIELIDSIIAGFKKFTNTKEEELYSIIDKGYKMSFKSQFEPQKYCETIWKGFFTNLKEAESEFLTVTLKNQFDNDFMKPDGAHNTHLKTQEMLKKWKDILSRRISLKLTPNSLIDTNKKLTNFNYKMGFELPGQYLEIETEPFPERRILITKFEPNTLTGSVSKKRIIMRTNTGKRLFYSIYLNVKQYEKATKTDERITQLKVFLNKIFMYHNTETMRRGIKLGVFKKLYFPYTKLYEENNISSLDEVYKLACSESGVDSDCASSIYINEMQKIYDKKNEVDRQTLDTADQEKIVKKVNKFMRKIIDKKYLTNYFKNSIKTMDEYYMFRKQFTQYYGTN